MEFKVIKEKAWLNAGGGVFALPEEIEVVFMDYKGRKNDLPLSEALSAGIVKEEPFTGETSLTPLPAKEVIYRQNIPVMEVSFLYTEAAGMKIYCCNQVKCSGMIINLKEE